MYYMCIYLSISLSLSLYIYIYTHIHIHIHIHIYHTCHNLPPSEINLGLCLAVFASSEGRYLFHRIG